MIERSETITTIAGALLLAQKEIEPVKKEAENPYFKSKYADLPSLIEACRPILNKHKILVLQPTVEGFVETILIHAESGEWISGRTKIASKAENDPQAQGSAITYARRYGLQAMLFMSAEDDDAEGAMARTPAAGNAATAQADLRKQFSINPKQVAPKCPNCSANMLLIKRKDGSGVFWMCPNWKTKGCKGLNVTDVDVTGKVVKKDEKTKETPPPEKLGKDAAMPDPESGEMPPF